MCTVTYIPTKNGFVLTSNRDEHELRETLEPTFYQHGDKRLVYPKDQRAGGTWIATDGKNRIACILNGAFEKHYRKDSYSRSRGKVVLEAFDFNTQEEFVNGVELHNVEPFTLILIDFQNELKITEYRWDEHCLHVIPKDNNSFYIWSSTTLYDLETRILREQWFIEWITKYRQDDHNIMNFHMNRHTDSTMNDIMMDRNNGLKTVCVTQFVKEDYSSVLHHFNMIEGKNTIHKILD